MLSDFGERTPGSMTNFTSELTVVPEMDVSEAIADNAFSRTFMDFWSPAWSLFM